MVVKFNYNSFLFIFITSIVGVSVPVQITKWKLKFWKIIFFSLQFALTCLPSMVLNSYVVICFIYCESFRKQDLALLLTQSAAELLLNGLLPALLQLIETYDIYFRYNERKIELDECGFYKLWVFSTSKDKGMKSETQCYMTCLGLGCIQSGRSKVSNVLLSVHNPTAPPMFK